MTINRKSVVIAAVAGALAAGGVGVATAIGGGESDQQVTGPDADKARSAALDAVGGGTVTEIERQDGDGAGAFEVEVRREDGSQVEVYVDGNYQAVGSAADDASGSGREAEGAGDDGEAGEDD